MPGRPIIRKGGAVVALMAATCNGTEGLAIIHTSCITPEIPCRDWGGTTTSEKYQKSCTRRCSPVVEPRVPLLQWI
jgi:hypothetical protein